jgi:hypothetical protein
VNMPERKAIVRHIREAGHNTVGFAAWEATLRSGCKGVYNKAAHGAAA